MREKMRDEVKIQDLFEGAYLMVEGFNLKELNITNSENRKIVTFTFTGEQITGATAQYRSGQASCNIAMLKYTMTHLKNMMFEKIRSMERTGRKTCTSNNKREFVSPHYSK